MLLHWASILVPGSLWEGCRGDPFTVKMVPKKVYMIHLRPEVPFFVIERCAVDSNFGLWRGCGAVWVPDLLLKPVLKKDAFDTP